MHNRQGKINDIDKFDGLFFGLTGHTADETDPESRILLETAFEAIVDAGEIYLCKGPFQHSST